MTGAARKKRIGVVFGAALVVLCLSARPGQGADRIRVTGTAVTTPAGEVVREIDDPHTGDRWLLVRDGAHSGGPGRMVLAESLGARDGSQASEAPEKHAPVVRNGDRVVIEEDTAVVHAWFEAVALGSAMEGGQFNARLTAGGKVVRVIALGAGRAAFAPDGELQP